MEKAISTLENHKRAIKALNLSYTTYWSILNTQRKYDEQNGKLFDFSNWLILEICNVFIGNNKMANEEELAIFFPIEYKYALKRFREHCNRH